MTEETKLPKLIPDVPPDVEPVEVPMSELPPDALLLSPEVSTDLVESLKEWGLMQPIVVGPVDEHGDRPVFAGKRRIKAARELEWETIPAYEVTQPDHQGDPLVLMEQLNSTARPNPMQQLEAIEHLEGEGYSEKDIAKALKLKLGTVRARLKLKELHPTLKEAVRRNKFSIGNAYKVAKMSKATQERLAARYMADGKLPWSVIDEERRKKVDAAGEGLGLDFADTPGAEAFVGPGAGFEAPAYLSLETEEREALEGKIERVRAGKKPAWSKADAESVAKLLGLSKGE